jgi:hypothetical protein
VCIEQNNCCELHLHRHKNDGAEGQSCFIVLDLTIYFSHHKNVASCCVVLLAGRQASAPVESVDGVLYAFTTKGTEVRVAVYL